MTATQIDEAVRDLAPRARARRTSQPPTPRQAMARTVSMRVLQVAIIVGFLVIWQVGAANGWISTFLFSSPGQIVQVLIRNASTGQLWTDIGITSYEVLVGYVIGALGGSLLGLFLWYSRYIADLSAPFITAIGAIPVLAIAPMMIIWFGTGLASKIFIVAFSCVVVSLTNAYRGAQKVDPDLLNLMRSFGSSKTKTFLKAVVPGAMPWVMAGLKLNVGFAIIGAIVGEFISSQAGVGHMIVSGSTSFAMSVVLAGVVVVMVMVLVMTFIVDLAERIFVRWDRN